MAHFFKKNTTIMVVYNEVEVVVVVLATVG